MTDQSDAKGSGKRVTVRKLVPLAVLLAGLGLFFIAGFDAELVFKAMGEHRDWLQAQIARYGLLANLGFIVLYGLVIAFSIPGGAVLTIAGGFLFGTWATTGCVIVGATLGALALFLAARSALFDLLHAKAGPALLKMERGFKENAFNYLLVLRLIPLFPFWLVNLVPALLGVPVRTYVIATAIGIIPGTFVFASIGNGLGAILEAGGRPDLTVILEAEVLIPILGLAVLALLPVLYKWWKGRREKDA